MAGRALRISQLDSSVLDEEVLESLKIQLSRCFSVLGSGTISSFLPELNSVLRCAIWLLSVGKSDSTPGQQMLTVKYSKYCKDKAIGIEAIGKYVNNLSVREKITNLSRWIECLWKVARLINFLVFLQQGRYQSLIERIFRLNTVLIRKQPVRQVSFEFMNRELLWHSFAEFTFFLLPLVNVRRLRNTVHHVFATHSSTSLSPSFAQCGICESRPTIPYQASCDHIFCYYCIKANCMADPAFSCPLCSSKVESIQPAYKQSE